MEKLKCLNCNNELSGNQRKYCSQKCANHYTFAKWYANPSNKKIQGERGSKWSKLNAEKVRKLAQERRNIKNAEKILARLEKPLYCKVCGKELNINRSVFCSQKCTTIDYNRKKREYMQTPEGRKWNTDRCRENYHKYREKRLAYLYSWREKNPDKVKEITQRYLQKRKAMI
jgi:endogenous inhibitor of DNA gyrase (YacG/DUF329 family)